MHKGIIMTDKSKLCVFRLTPDMHHKIKSEALKIRISLQDWIEEALEDKLMKDKNGRN